MELLQPEIGLLFWMLLAFGIVFFILAKFGFPMIIKMVEERKTFIEKSLDSAKEANKQLANIKIEGDAILVAAQKEQANILKSAAEARDKIIAEAREQAIIEGQKQLEEVKLQIQSAKDEAIKDIRRQVAELSIDIAEKVLRNNLENEKEQQSLIDRLLDETLVSKS